MAKLYVGRSTGIGSFERHVVLKMILPERAHDDIAVQMFLDEARLAASLNHQNVAQVFEVGEDAGMHFLAMEYVHGQDLRALLARVGNLGTRVPLDLALTIVAGAASGLHHAHERRTSDGVPMGIVHRDVSPSNIMVGYDGAVKLLDFGIAKATLRSIETQSGIIKGKFAYMSPEQCRGREVDARSDVFALGIILYEVTTQHRCFRADSDFDTMHRIVTGDVLRPTRLVPGYPPALEAIVLSALAVDVHQRYASAAQLLEAIEGFAIAARMSLSTMALGRFMRDMFGDVPEPWLTSARARTPTPAKEQTISNTNGTGSGPRGASSSSPQLRAPSPAPEARPSSPPVGHDDAPMHLLAEPGDSIIGANLATSTSATLDPALGVEIGDGRVASAPGHHGESSGAVGRGTSAPGVPPGFAIAATVQGEQRMSSPHLHAMVQPPGGLVWPNGSQPIAPPLVAAGGTPLLNLSSGGPPLFSSNTGPGIGGAPRPMGLPPGMAGMAGMTGMGASQAGHDSAQVHRVNPSAVPGNRWLYIALGIVLVGIIVLLGISIFDTEPDIPPLSRPAPLSPPSTQPAQPGATAAPKLAGPPIQRGPDSHAPPAGGSAEIAAATHGAAAPLRGAAAPPRGSAGDAEGSSGAAPPAPPPTASSITIRITSTPSGADVLLAGTPIGSTPLEIPIPKRRAVFAQLTVHRARYVDATATIDLSADYTSHVKLTALGEDSVPRPSVRPSPPRDPRRPTGPTSAPPPPAKKCQPPDRINPFDTSCGGKACPPCST